MRTFLYCPDCRKAWLTVDQGRDDHGDPNHGGESIDFAGVTIVEEFVTEADEERLCEEIDGKDWINSQSGRRKQVFDVLNDKLVMFGCAP